MKAKVCAAFLFGLGAFVLGFNLFYNVPFQNTISVKNGLELSQDLDVNKLVELNKQLGTELNSAKAEIDHLKQLARKKLSLVDKCLCSDSNFSSFETEDIRNAISSRMNWTKSLPYEIENDINRYFQASRDAQKRNLTRNGHKIFDALGPVSPQCRRIEMYGTEKRACGLKALFSTMPCTVVSLGISHQWGFEEAIYREMPNCHVHTFDCTLTSDVRPPNTIASRTTLHPICIGIEDEIHKQELKFMSWKSIMKFLNMSRPPSYLKMDLGGHEFEVLRNMMQDNYLLPMQIAMKLHCLTHVNVSWKARRKKFAEIGSFMEFLHHAGGYFLIDRHDNSFCLHCSEILVSRLLCPCDESDSFSVVSKKFDNIDYLKSDFAPERDHLQIENQGSQLPSLRNRLLDGCGDICRIDTPGTPSKFFDFIKKEVDCDGLWGNSAIDELRVGSPPPELPKEMLMDFTYNFKVRVVSYESLLDQRYAGGTAEKSVWEADFVEDWSKQCREGTLEGNYGKSETASLLDNVRRIPVVGSKILVIGSENPWVEACLLSAGAEHITTLEYGKIVSEHPKISTITPHEMRMRSADFMGYFDAVVTFSSVEHSGLGRYGDQMNPWGDRQAIARAWCLTKPGGYLAIGVPTGEDLIEYNAHRSYGSIMYPHLVANWQQQWRAEGDQGQRVHVFSKAVINDLDSVVDVAPPGSAARSPWWIAVQFEGRLGNQMFQAASCYGIAKSRGGRCCFLDNSDILDAGVTFHEPFIRCPDIAFRNELEGTKNQDFVGSLMHGYGDVRVGIFLQSWLYFVDSLPFKLREQDWGMDWVQRHNVSVGIHVCRGDFGDNFPVSFFEKAIAKLRLECKHTIFPSEFVIATDDVAWVRQQKLFNGTLVLEGQSPAQDMAILAACKHLIFSIGTFGWWAAYMKVRPGLVLHYMPRYEIEDVRDHNATAYYPPGWIGFLYEPGDPCHMCEPDIISWVLSILGI
jgi:hypothetical protein